MWTLRYGFMKLERREKRRKEKREKGERKKNHAGGGKGRPEQGEGPRQSRA